MNLINKYIYKLKEQLKDRDTLIERLLEDLEEIREAVWGYDIPSPTVPEYIEHHEQIQELLKLIDEKIKSRSTQMRTTSTKKEQSNSTR